MGTERQMLVYTCIFELKENYDEFGANCPPDCNLRGAFIIVVLVSISFTYKDQVEAC